MTRRTFGGQAGDFVARVQGSTLHVVPGKVTFWTARTGGSQVTDLLDINNNPATFIVTDSAGQIPPFSGPNDGTDVLWADAGGALRTLLMATDTGSFEAINQMTITALPGQTAQLLQTFDSLGNPIAGIPLAGGFYVSGDNIRVFAGGDVFNPIIKLRADGTIQMAKGDPAGGAGVIALGNATTKPTGVPDGSHTLDGSTTVAGGILYADNGQLKYLDTDGHTFAPEMPGSQRSYQMVTKDAGATTLSSVGTPAVGTLGTLANSDASLTGQWLGLQTGAVSGNNAAVKAASFSQVRAAWAPIFWTRILTDPANMTSSRIWVGLFSADPSGTSTPSQAIGFRYDTGVDGTAFWRTYTQDGTTANVTTTTSSVAANTKYDLRIIVNAAYTQVRFLINEVTVATHTTNLPTFSTQLGPAAYITTLTAAARNLLFSRWVMSFNG